MIVTAPTLQNFNSSETYVGHSLYKYTTQTKVCGLTYNLYNNCGNCSVFEYSYDFEKVQDPFKHLDEVNFKILIFDLISYIVIY
jgi:hypothetical protein